jgi:hypothetical protein
VRTRIECPFLWAIGEAVGQIGMSRLWSEQLYDADSKCVSSYNLNAFFLSDSRVIVSWTFSEILYNVRNTNNVSVKHFFTCE